MQDGPVGEVASLVEPSPLAPSEDTASLPASSNEVGTKPQGLSSEDLLEDELSDLGVENTQQLSIAGSVPVEQQTAENPYQKLFNDPSSIPPRDPQASAKYLSHVIIPDSDDSSVIEPSDEQKSNNPYYQLQQRLEFEPLPDRAESSRKYLEHTR